MSALVSLVLLWGLASLDGAFIGFRAAAGRSGLIRKGLLYRRAMLKGVMATQVASALVGAVAWGCIRWAPDGDDPFGSFRLSTMRMLMVFGPYALMLLGAMLLRVPAEVDLRSSLSVLIFGPLTLLRPVVCLGGLGWAWAGTHTAWDQVPLLLEGALMLGLGPLLDGWLRPATSPA